jgi:hypothetical protein
MPESDDEKRALRDVLTALAAQRTTVTYRDLVRQVGIAGPHSIHRLTGMLEDLIRDDHARGRPLLAALVVSRTPPGLPQRGYFELLSELGGYRGAGDGEAALNAHRAELARAWDYWGGAA